MAEITEADFNVSPDWITAFVVMSEDIGALYKKYCGFNLTQCRILLEINRNEEGIRVGRLAHLLNLRPNTVTAAVDALNREGVVTRLQESKDRRAVCLQVTEKGKKAVAQIEDATEEYASFLKANLSEAKREKLLHLFSHIWEKDKRARTKTNQDLVSFIHMANNLLSDIILICRDYGLSLIEMRIITQLTFIRNACRVSLLAKMLGLRSNVVTVSADGLEEKKMLQRTPDPLDRRAVLLSPTPEATRLVKEVTPEIERKVLEYLGSLPKTPPSTITKHHFKEQ